MEDVLLFSLSFLKGIDVMYIVIVSFIVSLICEKFVSHFKLDGKKTIFFVYVIISFIILLLTYSDLSQIRLFIFNGIIVTLLSSYGSVFVQYLITKRKDTSSDESKLILEKLDDCIEENSKKGINLDKKDIN